MNRAVVVALAALPLVACAANTQAPLSPVALEVPPQAAPAPKPLTQSYFAAEGNSRLTEAEIGRILDAPVTLSLPARVGVAALGEAFKPVRPETIDAGVNASRALAQALEDTRMVSVASEVSSDLPTGGGVEGLRELAARYRSPYLVLYTEKFEDRSYSNGWSVLWPTIVGGLLSPSVTLTAEGVLEATVLDVRTGTLLFTVQEPVRFEETHLPLGAGGAFRDLKRKAADDGAKRLATRVVEKWRRLAEAAAAPGTPEETPPRS